MLTAHAYVSAGRWLARCPRSGCGRTEWFDGLRPDRYVCGCGQVVGVLWPPHPESIDWVLGQRPDSDTRGWHPWESLRDLLVENAEHGILPPDGLVINDTRQRLVVDSMPGGQ